LKAVKRLALRWTDGDDQEWTLVAKIEDHLGNHPQDLQDLAMRRLAVMFDDWRRG